MTLSIPMVLEASGSFPRGTRENVSAGELQSGFAQCEFYPYASEKNRVRTSNNLYGFVRRTEIRNINDNTL